MLNLLIRWLSVDSESVCSTVRTARRREDREEIDRSSGKRQIAIVEVGVAVAGLRSEDQIVAEAMLELIADALLLLIELVVAGIAEEQRQRRDIGDRGTRSNGPSTAERRSRSGHGYSRRECVSVVSFVGFQVTAGAI